MWRWVDFSLLTRYFFAIFYDYSPGGAKAKEQTEDKAASALLTNRTSFFGKPDTILPGEDSRFIGSGFSRFRNEQNINLQTVIPGSHQILGPAERGHRYFKELTLQIKDKNRINKRDP